MQWLDYVSWFFGGAFLTNAVPHFVSGVMGRPFQSPFAGLPGEGLSFLTINVLWGFFNLAVELCSGRAALETSICVRRRPCDCSWWLVLFSLG